MNKTIPAIAESEAELKKLMRQEQGVRHQRLQVLYLLVSRQSNRSQAARLVGVHRNSVQTWLTVYAEGGLSALLRVEKAPGRAPTLSGAPLERLRAKLTEPDGFGSYGEIRDWIEAELGIVMEYETVRKLVRYRLGAKLKRARPSHIKNASAIAAFPAQVAHMWQVTTRQQARPLKLWVMDESRFGLQTVQRRRITLRGVKPMGSYQHRFENFYLYGAVCPCTGEGDFMVARRLEGTALARFIQQILTEQPTYHHVFLLDNSKTHTLTSADFPANATLLFQPPYAPELNPIERVWHDAKGHLAWRTFATLFELQAAVEAIFLAYSDDQLISLTAADYLITAISEPELPVTQLTPAPALAA